MWSPNTSNRHTNGHTNSHTNLPSSSSSSSSSSSAILLCSPTPKRKTMEEVWKDINLPALCHVTHPSTPFISLHSPPPLKLTASSAAPRPNFRTVIFQDFLAGDFSDHPSAAAGVNSGELSLPHTVLSLSNTAPLRAGPDYSGFGPDPPNSNLGGSDEIFFASKKVLDDSPCIASADRRFKRMIKNRESAARSRARKQAYTNELELEVAHLAEENTLLKQQNEKLQLAIAAQLPKRKSLQKTSSAPF